ncbi:MAG TPA: serine/threonine-protein kinase [Kofleriaceae bacterium]|nr:serine/threonine-protein kinase [Kofleriaceae bacterium]
MSAFIGKVLGQNYRVVEPIGAGAMGMVYVVEHVALKKRFAAKLLTADLARHPEAIARFEVEAHAASQLDHENIVSVIDYGKTDDGCVFLIMELLRGKTLQARMDQGPAAPEEIVAIVVQVCHALAAAHAAGIVHRDMKPENIFLTQRPGGRPVVKVLDFGISKARESSVRDGRITKQGQLLGSPEYMSPEASRGDEVDARADIYAVGVILYELLCGEVPFRHENYLKVLQMHANQLPRSPRELVPDMPLSVERLIMRALDKDPDRRQSTIEELEAELVAALPEAAHRALLQSTTPPPGPWLPSSTNPMMFVSGTNPGLAEGSGTSHSPGQPDATTLDTRRGRRRVMAALWGGVLVAGAAAAALWGLKWYQEQNPAHRTEPEVASAAATAGTASGEENAAAARPIAAGIGDSAGASGGAAAEAIPAGSAGAEQVGADSQAPGKTSGHKATDHKADRTADRDSGDSAADSAAADSAADSAVSDPAAQPVDELAERAAHRGEVRLRLATSPSGAAATVAGKRVGRTPLDTWLPAADHDAEVELELRGYRTATRSLSLDRDHDLRVSLHRDSRRGSSASSSRKSKSSTRPSEGDDRTDRPPADLDIKEGR